MFDSKNVALFLQGKATLSVNKHGEATPQDAQIATTVLLAHAAGIDNSVKKAEFDSLARTLIRHFKLQDHEAGELLEIADFLIRDRAKIDQFIILVNQNFEKAQKIALLTEIVRIIQADGCTSELEAQYATMVAEALGLDENEINQAVG